MEYGGLAEADWLHAAAARRVSRWGGDSDSRHQFRSPLAIFRTEPWHSVWLHGFVFRRKPEPLHDFCSRHYSLYYFLDYSAVAHGGLAFPGKIVEGRRTGTEED